MLDVQPKLGAFHLPGRHPGTGCAGAGYPGGLRHHRNEILADLDRGVRVPFVISRQQWPSAA
jgi:hypothetical protein